jgi:uncharacterized protein (DUF2384 family)
MPQILPVAGGDCTPVVWRRQATWRHCGAPAHASNDADKVCEVVHVQGLASHRKHVVGQVIDVVPYPVEEIEEFLRLPLNALERIRMSEGCRTGEKKKSAKLRLLC